MVKDQIAAGETKPMVRFHPDIYASVAEWLRNGLQIRTM